FTDRTTTTTVTISFPTGTGPVQYSPPCIKVKTTTMVTFSGTFANHPLRPGAASTSLGTDSPGNPIASTSDGSSAQFVFSNTGTFGFFCNLHPGIMRGAIMVVQ